MIANIETAVQLLIPIVVGQIYTRTLSLFQGTLFCVAALLMVIVLCLSFKIKTENKSNHIPSQSLPGSSDSQGGVESKPEEPLIP